VWNLPFFAMKGDGDEELVGKRNKSKLSGRNYGKITSIKSLSFCMRSFSPSLTNCPGKYRLHVTKELP
jgi:hypothetical protein